jgi:hypothetical protein
MDFTIHAGGYKFDFFITDAGSLGFTVSNEDDDDHSVDIFVNDKLEVSNSNALFDIYRSK